MGDKDSLSSETKVDGEKNIVQESSDGQNSQDQDPTIHMNERQKRLFQIQLKINQGRKLNKIEVENEYKRLTDPRHGQGGRYSKNEDSNPGDSSEPTDSTRKSKTKGKQPIDEIDSMVNNHFNKKPSEVDMILNTTAADSFTWKEKLDQKERNIKTHGWTSFGTDSVFKAYDKKVSKLAVKNSEDIERESRNEYTSTVTSLQDHLLSHGTKTSTADSKQALDRLGKELEERDKERAKFSRRRTHFDAIDVDYINSDNAHFNKKIKKAFNKYTVEIRQNLERGTAV